VFGVGAGIFVLTTHQKMVLLSVSTKQQDQEIKKKKKKGKKAKKDA